METKYLVVDNDHNPLCDNSDGFAIIYKKFRDAEKAAKAHAEENCGKKCFVLEFVAEVRVPPGSLETIRKYPVQHYK